MASDLMLSSACILGLFLLPSGAVVAQTGVLTQLAGTDACVSEDGTGGDCADGVGIDNAVGVTVSRDGRNVYVVADGDSAVAVFARDRNGPSLAVAR